MIFQLIARTGKGIYLCRRTYIYERDLDVYLSALRGKGGEYLPRILRQRLAQLQL